MSDVEVLDRAEISGTTVLVAYSKTEATLAELRAKYAGLVFDLTTTKGDKDARAARQELVKLRTSLEAKRKEFKAPALALGRKIDSEAERVNAEIVALETPIDEQIRADEKRRADEKAERDRIEALRVQGLRDKIAAIRGFVEKCHGISAERIANGIELVSKIDTSKAVFAELEGEALSAQATTLQTMRTMHAAAVEREAEAARIEAQRIENERIAAENKAVADALAAQKAAIEKAAADLKAAQDAAAKEQEKRDSEERDRLAAEAAKAEKEARDKLAAEQADAARAAAQAQPAPEPAPTAPVPRPQSGPAIVLNIMPASQAAKPAPDTPPTLTLGEISSRLGFQVTSAFLASLGFEATTVKAAELFHESDFGPICQALVTHISEVSDQFAAVAA